MTQNPPYLSRIIFDQAKKYGQREFLYYRNDATATWESISWEEAASQVRTIAHQLIKFGIKRGDRVGIFSQNMYQHIIADFATISINAVSVPIYATSSVEQVDFIINDASIHTIFVGETEQLSTLSKASAVKNIIVFDDNATIPERQEETQIYKYATLLHKNSSPELNKEMDDRMNGVTNDDLVSILYTSGTTGTPKGVELRQSNYTACMKIHFERFKIIDETDRSLSFLPLTHIYERAWTYLCIYKGVQIYINHLPSEVQDRMKEVRPTAMCAVPRLWEKIYTAIQKTLESKPIFVKEYFKWCIKLGERYHIKYKRLNKHASKDISAYYKIFARPLFNKIKREIGLENGKFLACAGAKLSDELNTFFHAMGINLCYGYGLTETTASVSCYFPENLYYVIGSTGSIMTDVKVKVSPEGEILIKGDTVTKGYFNNPDATRRAFTDDGWFKSGDSGFIDMENNLYIRERIKDLFKTAGGKFVAPQQLEGLMCQNQYVDQAVAIGNDRKFISMLIVPDFKELKSWAKDNYINITSTDTLISLPEVKDLYAKIIKKQTGHLARYEQIKKFTLLPKAFTIEQGHLTNTLKIRRKVINEIYASQIEAMYSETDSDMA